MSDIQRIEVITEKIFLIGGVNVMLDSDRAIHVNIQIMRAFIIIRQMSIDHKDLKQKIIAMERKYDKQFQIVFEAIKQLLEEDEKPKRKIGYVKTPKNSSGKKKYTHCSQ
jgi:hypothetical protein